MLFNSLQYALFLPLLTAVYFGAPRSWRLVVLLVGSYVFYAAWNPAYLLLIIAMTAANYVFGLLLGRTSGRPAATRWLVLAVSMNVAVLAYYKYMAFLLASVEGLLRSAGVQIQLPQPSIILPLAISFFTFEFIHYVVDVWAGQPPERGFLKFAVFAAFFPTQIAGPIKRYEAFIPQLDVPSRFEWTRAGEGLKLITWGLFKKIVLADRLGAIVALGFPETGHAVLNPVDAWLTVLAFAMQIYLDFSGYTDIGRGSAVILGFSVPENFRRPYLAWNISEFWRRWHISLSTWLRDYLFVPLGGLRGHPARALLVTMALAGLWHGAGWHFVVWGLFNGVLLTGHWMFRAWRARRGDARRRAEGFRLPNDRGYVRRQSPGAGDPAPGSASPDRGMCRGNPPHRALPRAARPRAHRSVPAVSPGPSDRRVVDAESRGLRHAMESHRPVPARQARRVHLFPVLTTGVAPAQREPARVSRRRIVASVSKFRGVTSRSGSRTPYSRSRKATTSTIANESSHPLSTREVVSSIWAVPLGAKRSRRSAATLERSGSGVVNRAPRRRCASRRRPARRRAG